ncbi:restriction endonuclease subunit S [Patescibacteria group bacterium]|nr:restriction endonuclease subunit S [Patescibacteria group bacterium]
MKNWQTKKLGEVFQIERGGSPRPIESFLTTDENGINWIKIGDTKNITKYIYKTEEKIKPSGLNKTRLVKEGDFILSNSMSFGRPYIMKTTGAIHDGWLVLRKKQSDIDKDFFYYLLGSPVVFDQFDNLAAGSTVRNLNTKLVASIDVSFPSLVEQKLIVKILDNIFRKIEKVRENAERNLQNSRELFESYLQKSFSNSGWDIKNLGDVCENLDSKRIPVTKRDRVNGNYPYYGASGIVDYVNDYIFDEDLLLVSEDGANLLARTYPIAFSILGKSWVNNHAHVLRFKKRETQKFYEYYLNSIDLASYVSGMAQPKLNQGTLNLIKVPSPSVEEQREIVKKLDGLSGETRKLEEIYKQKLADLEELKKSVLQKAFSGEM